MYLRGGLMLFAGSRPKKKSQIKIPVKIEKKYSLNIYI